MAFTFGFYNSLNGDRKYNAIEMSSIFDGIIKDGIFMSIGTAMMVTVGSGMTVNVGIGRAWFNHTWTLNDALYPITIDRSEVLQDRIDIIALQIDSSVAVRTNSFVVIKGVASSTPVAPALILTDTLKQYALCEVYVTRGSSSITPGNITNRVGTSTTPFITGILETMDIDALLVKWEAQFASWHQTKRDEFQAWFLSLRDILDDDAITALTLRVLDLEEGFEELKKSVSDGKSTIAAAITLQGVITAATATFAQMATNIKAIIRGSGTALASHVLSPYTFTNSTGVQLTGTIPSKAGATITPGTSAQTLAAGQYLSGTQTIANLGGTATAGQVLATVTFSSNNAGRAVQGTIPSRGAATITPSTSQQVITAGQFLSGAQTIPGASTLVAGNIKKGISIFGVTGTWEGWVPGSGDLYNRGSWGLATGFTVIPYQTWQEGSGWQTNVPAVITIEQGMVTLKGGYWNAVRTNNLINLTGFTTLNVTMSSTKTGYNQSRIATSTSAPTSTNPNQNLFDRYINITSGFGTLTERTFTLDISGVSGSRYVSFGHYTSSDGLTIGTPGEGPYYSYIHRVWLS